MKLNGIQKVRGSNPLSSTKKIGVQDANRTLKLKRPEGFSLLFPPLLPCPTRSRRKRQPRITFLSAEENSSITCYRLLRPVMPWPQLIIGVALTPEGAQVTGTREVNVVMKIVGNAQLWWGGSTGVLW